MAGAPIGRLPGLVRQSRRLAVWLGLLGLAELTDLVTTHADRLKGGAEANGVAWFAMATGGPGFFWTIKLVLVAAMAALVLLVIRFGRSSPGHRAAVASRFTTRALQLCVVALTISSIGNLAVLAWLASTGSRS